MTLPAIDLAPPRPRRPLGIGLVGAGRIARHAHLPAYRQAGFPVAAILDVDRAAAERAAREFAVPHATANLEELLANPAVEVVDVAIPGPGRLPIVRAAVAAGKHVLAQKSLADSYREAVEMVDLARAAGVRLAANQNARWAPEYRATAQLIHAGAIGQPFFLLHQLWSSQDRDPGAYTSWYGQGERYQIGYYMIHFLDVVRLWLRQEPERVVASLGRHPDQHFRGEVIASVSLQFASGALATLVDCNAAWPDDPTSIRFRVEGSAGRIEGEVGFQPAGSLRLRGAGEPEHAPRLEGSWFPDGFAGAMGELMAAVEQGREPETSGQDNLGTLRLVEAAYRSAAERRAVAPDEVG